MTDFTAKTICILGRQPELGIAELEARYGSDSITPIKEAALLNIDSSEINFKELGGTIKVGKILDILPLSEWHAAKKYLEKNIPLHLEQLEDGKVTLGLSVYGLKVDAETINRTLLGIKKKARAQGKSVRIVPNKSTELNSAQVLHNKLTSRGAWELLLVNNGNSTILAQTMFVQDIDAYSARDQNRPMRDSFVGMLPPKLAQIIINLAIGNERNEGTAPKTVLDPFCGTGVILQESLLMGLPAYGTDLEPRMIQYSEKNLEWLLQFTGRSGKYKLEVGDATDFKWDPTPDIVACETYLGRPLSSTPDNATLHKIIQDCNLIISKFLKNIQTQLKPNTRLCIAVPAWRINNELYHLPLIDHLTDMGYTNLDLVHVAKRDLIYYREDQLVARELLILQTKE